MDARSTLIRLVRIQDLSLAIRAAQDVADRAPGRIEEIEARFRERNAEYVALQERHDALQHDHRERSGELTVLEERRNKYTADLMNVKNQREYAAMLKEIDGVKAEIAGHDESILGALEALEQLKGQLQSFEEHIRKERDEVAEAHRTVEAEAQTARTQIEALGQERTEIERSLPEALVATVATLEARRQGVFLSRADNGTCQSCFVRVRPQKFQEIRQALAVHSCDNCRRFLYFEPALAAPADGPPVPRASVEAVNGGAV